MATLINTLLPMYEALARIDLNGDDTLFIYLFIYL